MRRLLAGVVASLGLTLLLAPAPARAAAGKLDTGFSDDGIATAFPKGSLGDAVAIDASGRIVVAGTALDGDVDVAVARFLPDGRPDPDFGGGDGRVRIDLGASEYGLDLAVGGGRIVVVGRRLTDTKDSMFAVALAPGGTLDPTFGGGDGVTLIDVGKPIQSANAVGVTSGGKVILGGFASNGVGGRIAVVRLTDTGEPDLTFSGDGIALADLSDGTEQVNDLIVLGGGKIVVAGTAETGTTQRFLAARYRSNGGIDASFGAGGASLVNLGPGGDVAESIALQTNGKLVLAGSAANGQDWGLARLSFDGAPDPSFGDDDGGLTIPFTDAAEGATGVAVQDDGRLVVIGRAKGSSGSIDLAIARREPDGSPDTTFGNGGLLTVDVFGSVDVGNALALQPNGKIVAVGQAWKSGHPRIEVVRVLAA